MLFQETESTKLASGIGVVRVFKTFQNVLLVNKCQFASNVKIRNDPPEIRRAFFQPWKNIRDFEENPNAKLVLSRFN